MRKNLQKFAVHKLRRKILVYSAIVTVTCAVTVSGYYVFKNINQVNASDGQPTPIFDIATEGVVHSSNLDAMKEPSSSSDSSILMSRNRSQGTLESYYNSHDEYHTYTRTKNQNTEGLCWLYAGSTTLEYALEANNMATSVSPKHIDYQFVGASNAYKANDVANGADNAYYNRWLSAGGYQRSFGDAGNNYTMLMTASNPYALVSESKFASIIKANDNRISSISKYEDIWDLNNSDSILTYVTALSDPTSSEQILAYAEKQNYNSINSASNTDYVVTGVGEIYYPDYGSSSEKTEIVSNIKQAVKTYGAVEVGSFFDSENCMDYSFDNDNNINITIIDRSNSNTTESECNGGHAMSIIGWDDDWAYQDNGTRKTGAFIIQNSYGDTMPVNTGNNQIVEYNANYYMSYDSAFDVIYFKSFDPLDNYDHYYSVADYKSSTIAPSSDEYIFEFAANNDEKLKKITFNQNFYTSESYDIYVSTTGAAANFSKVGSFIAYMGMTNYEFSDPIDISGDFAIKLKKTSGASINDSMERNLNVLNAFTGNSSGDPDPDPDPTQDPDPQPDPDPTSDPDPDPTPDSEPNGTVTWVQGKEYIIGSGEDLIVKVDYSIELLNSITLDDDNLPEDSYEIASGSTILTIYSDYLDTLDAGDHTIKFAYSNGATVSTSFTIAEDDLSVPNTSAAKSPETGGNMEGNRGKGNESFNMLYAAIAMFAVLAPSSYIIHRCRSQIKFRRK